MEIKTGWHTWKNKLGRFVDVAESIGMSEDRVNATAYRVGEFLANNIDPGNREQRLMKELWDEANEEQKKVLATLMVRLVEKEDPRH